MTSQKDDLTKEARLMTRLTWHPHPHLLPLLDVECDALSRVSMVAPIARFGSVLDLIDHLDFEGGELTHAHSHAIFQQIVSALLHLDALGLDHGDVALRNILVFEFNSAEPECTSVKLADYGETKKGRVSPVAVWEMGRELHGLVPR